MDKIIEQKKSGALRTISSDDRRDLQNYFAGRKPFAVSLVETSWYDRFDPYNESKWFFRKQEAALLKVICQARVIATGKRFSYDVELIYDDFIYLLRTFLNGNVKTSGGTEISLEQGATNDSQKIKEVVTQYTREGNLFIRGETSSAERYTKKAAALQRSIELEKKKQSGEKPLSKKDEMDYERKIKQLKDELDSVMRGESELLTDILSLEKMREEDSEFEIKELEDLENFAVENIRIINIKKTKKPINEHDVLINIVELASELAEKRMLEQWRLAKDCHSIEDFLESHYDEIYIEEDGVIMYTEDAQDDFTQYYGDYYFLIENCATNDPRLI
jgi:hypothetical protein